MKLWRCLYTREWIIGRNATSGYPLFGWVLPFIGWKRIPCDARGAFDHGWPPRYTILKVGVMWFGSGWFYTLPDERPERVSS